MRETLRMTRAAGIRAKGYLMIAHPTEGLDSLAEMSEFLRTAELDMAQVTKFTPYPGTPSYATIRDFGTFTENWEEMNAMNFVFIPHGLTAEILQQHFESLYRVYYCRPDVLMGLLRLMVHEPRFARQLASSALVYARSKLAQSRFFMGRTPRRYRAAVSDVGS
jgi:radical SAM superfamily enzyme YgiQ (UPF0313 family)